MEFLHDGNCPICRFDVANLRRRDREGRIRFIDISDPAFDPVPYGRDREALLARITARRADGLIVEGAEVFQLALAAVGLGWIAAPTRLPILSQITELAYTGFARRRVWLSKHFGGIFRRMTPPDCADGICHVPPMRKL
jgi:predicted DCC family thiol-disulfide oxidoreductase YuxK